MNIDFSMKKKSSRKPSFAAAADASDQLTKQQWDELMIASIRKLNEDEVRVVKYRICSTMNILAKKEFDLDLTTPISETPLLKSLDRAIEEGILTRHKNGSIVSYGIAGEKAGKVDLTVKDPLEDGKILASIVRSLLMIKRNEGQSRGFELGEIINLFEGANSLNFPEGEDKTSVLQNVVVGALKAGCISGHIRKLQNEYFVTGRSPTEGMGTSHDAFSTNV